MKEIDIKRIRYNDKVARRQSKEHKLAHPLCAHCYARGVVKQGEEVDHITPIHKGRTEREVRALLRDRNNLQTLCKDCHTAKTAAECRGRATGTQRPKFRFAI